ncbi:MAG: HlyD family efflux transporter periplasmic adaptor subunit [Bacteroidia bacterium]|nr:HlyD family efflux transporter periplasmic adaptor subunit [Bacteroidia bacterium]
MLNISQTTVHDRIDLPKLKSPSAVREFTLFRGIKWTFFVLASLLFITLFLPWTQTVPGKGSLTTLKPGQRPQALHSAIAGRIEHWYIREGDFVEAGDTLLFISEIKEDYFDPALLSRTQSQIEVKENSVSAYQEKVVSLEKQIQALEESKTLKMKQARNKIEQSVLKIQSDSIDLEAARTQFHIAEQQYARQKNLFDQGLKSLTELESRKLKLQETQADLISASNKLLTSKNELLNARIELTSVGNEMDQKIAKARADKFETLSSQFDTEASVTKLQSSYANYSVRSGLYYIRAPQSGYVTQTLKTGLGETIQQGEEILTIMPFNYEPAVELYISPQDLPLVSMGSKVRLVFDGWPALVFSGWPGISSGTFGGRVVAIDKFAGIQGKFRLLITPDPDENPWPELLRVGSGASGMLILNDVAVGYEIWRQLNGFPPEFYQNSLPKSPAAKSTSGKSK